MSENVDLRRFVRAQKLAILGLTARAHQRDRQRNLELLLPRGQTVRQVGANLWRVLGGGSLQGFV